jgi:hypothetical protein
MVVWDGDGIVDDCESGVRWRKWKQPARKQPRILTHDDVIEGGDSRSGTPQEHRGARRVMMMEYRVVESMLSLGTVIYCCLLARKERKTIQQSSIMPGARSDDMSAFWCRREAAFLL